MSDSTAPVPADDHAQSEVAAHDTDYDALDSGNLDALAGIAFPAPLASMVDDALAGIAFPAPPAKVDSAMARAAGRVFARDDYRATAVHLFRLRTRGEDVTARACAFAAMFSADSAAHPVAGYPEFDEAKWMASFTA